MNLPEEVRVAVVGHVDHGKSTLVGRLLVAQAAVTSDRIHEIEHASMQRQCGLDHAFLTDQLREERDRRITLDAAHAMLRTARTAITFVDTPGHRELVGNMLSGAGGADAAVLVVDAGRGLEPQTRLHLALLANLGVKQVVVVINKIDAADYDRRRHLQLSANVTDLLQRLGLSACAIVPVSARQGTNITEPCPGLTWYDGPPLMAVLETLHVAERAPDGPPCLVVEGQMRLNGRHVVMARLESGRCCVGEELVALPEGRRVRVERLREGFEAIACAQANACLGLELEPAPSLAHGMLLAGIQLPATVARRIRVRIVPMEDLPASEGDTVGLHSIQGLRQGRLVASRQRSGGSPALTGATEPTGGHCIEIHLDRPMAVLASPDPGAATAPDGLGRAARVVLTKGDRTWAVGRIEGCC